MLLYMIGIIVSICLLAWAIYKICFSPDFLGKERIVESLAYLMLLALGILGTLYFVIYFTTFF